MSRLDDAVRAIREAAPQTIAVLTGAGVSADSGIPTFRGEGGLWREYRAEDLATPEAFRRNPRLVWEWYEWRRDLIREALPNAAHQALAEVEDATIVTQNVDGLHGAAGSKRVIELHGNIFRVRCTREGTRRDQRERLPEIPPLCACGALLRPDVVWFGEMLPDGAVAEALAAIRAAELLLVIGTSGVVYPAAGFVALHEGLSIEVNPDAGDGRSACTMAVPERAAIAVPRLVSAFLESR
jgi:NAD-dependent deacetylase